MRASIHIKYIILIAVAFAAMTLLCIRWHNRPSVHYAKQLEIDQLVNTFGGRPGDQAKDELFIISNAPKNRIEVIRVIEENEKLCPIDKKRIESRYDYFQRTYYRASWQTPVDFVQRNKDDDLYSERHRKDLICWIRMEKTYFIKRRRAASAIADSLGIGEEDLPKDILDSIAHLPDSVRNGWGWKWECNCPELGY